MPERPPPAAPRDTPLDRLVAAQAALGLTQPDLAAALHISTQRLHQLMCSGEGAQPLGQREAERFDAVERVARAWQARSAAPMRALAHLPMANGRTGLDLLVADTVTDQNLAAALNELCTRCWRPNRRAPASCWPMPATSGAPPSARCPAMRERRREARPDDDWIPDKAG